MTKFILIFLIYFINCEYINLPLKRKEFNDTNNDELILKLKKNLFETTLKMGTPSKEYKVLVDISNEYFFQMSSKELKNDTYESYDEESKSLEKIGKSKIDASITLSKDILYLPYSQKKVSFALKTGNIGERDTAGIIGLMILPYMYSGDIDYNFIKTLKNNDIIDNYYFSFSFKNLNEGNLYIGTLPNEYDDNFKNLDILNTRVPINDDFANWGLTFVSVKYGDKEIITQDKLSMFIKLGNQFFYMNKEMNETVHNDFFSEHISKGECQIKEIASINVIICDNKVDISKFKTLYFYESTLNYTFTLDYNDLFFKANNKYIFLMVMEQNSEDYSNILLGEVFLRKYRTVFNQDQNTVGFMIKNNKSVTPEHKINTTAIIIVIVSIIAIFSLLYYIFILRKKIFKRKYGKELEDDYLYLTK